MSRNKTKCSFQGEFKKKGNFKLRNRINNIQRINLVAMR
jgi:hypothetical protein